MYARRLISLATVLTLAVVGCGPNKPGTAPPAATPSTSATPSPSPAGTPTTPAPKGPASKTPAAFSAQISRIPSRSTVPYSWRPGCPVPLSGLRLLRMSYWGMDGRPHTGEMVVNARVAKDVVSVFRKLYGFHYPIRRMRLVDVYKGSDFASIEADNTSAFNCRRATGSSSWSQHAFGLAIDLNTCENPYVSADGQVDHKNCVKYKNRSRRDPGLIHAGDRVVRAFASIGWGWGGNWSGTKDYQHFSASGR